MVNSRVAVRPLLSVARGLNVKIPACIGVPCIAPPEATNRPFGSVPLARLQLYGEVPPDAVNGWSYAMDTWPFGSDDVVITGDVELIGNVKGLVASTPVESLTSMVKLNVPGVVGDPEAHRPMRM